jgi:hypothetical protein
VIYGQLSEKHRWKVSLLTEGQPGTKSAGDPDLTYYQYLFDSQEKCFDFVAILTTIFQTLKEKIPKKGSQELFEYRTRGHL